MRIGVVSDTHNNLKNVKRIVELFNEAQVDRVIHTGDITQIKTIDLLKDLDAPLYGVYGNNDLGELHLLEHRIRHYGLHFVHPPLTLNWAGRQIIVVHDPLELQAVNIGGADVILHGHTHLKTVDFEYFERGSRLTFNPGECAGMIQGSNAIGILDLLEMKPEIIKF